MCFSIVEMSRKVLQYREMRSNVLQKVGVSSNVFYYRGGEQQRVAVSWG
jgi:predicted ABC-type transport system involved in lysophospholipase L1 biosynthesis ATPase subunit